MRDAQDDTIVEGVQGDPIDALLPPAFFSSVIGNLAGLLECMIGLQDAARIISTLGSNIGQRHLSQAGPDCHQPTAIALDYG